MVRDGIVSQFRIAALAFAHVDVDLFGLDDPAELGHIPQIDGQRARAATLVLPASGRAVVLPFSRFFFFVVLIPQLRQIVAEVVVLTVFPLAHLALIRRMDRARRADGRRPVAELHPPA